MPRKDTASTVAHSAGLEDLNTVQGVVEAAAGPEVAADTSDVAQDVQNIVAAVEPLPEHLEQFISDARARISQALSPLSVIASHEQGASWVGTIKTAVEDAFHEMVRHFVVGPTAQPPASPAE